MRKATKFVVTILLILLVSSMALMFSGCNNDRDPVYEIRLYDDDWDELEKIEGYNNHYKDYEIEYDGNKKGVNIKCLIDGEEFYTYDYREIRYYKTPIPVDISIKGGSPDYPVARGEYEIECQFDKYLHGGVWHTASGKTVSYSDLPITTWASIKIIIV